MLRIVALLLVGVACIPGGSAQGAEPTLKLDLGSGVSMELVLVEKGTFEQGSPESEKGRNDDETLHEVTLTKSFYLGKYPVTRGQFAQFVKETRFKTEAESGPSGGFGWEGDALKQKPEYSWRNPGFEQTDDHPVVLVTYEDVQKFLAWANGKTKRKLTLPTEAQWEYAARAGATTAFPGGDDAQHLAAVGWYKENAGDGTRPVGKKAANAWGLYDMHGNVYEWCRDWFGPYESGPLTDPEQIRSDLSDKPRRVLRGGAFHKEVRHCRNASRYRNDPKSRNADNGFRVALLVEETKPTPVPQSAEPPKPVGPPKPVQPPRPTETPIPVEAPLPSSTPQSPAPEGQPKSADIGTDHGHEEHGSDLHAAPARQAMGLRAGVGGLCCCALVGVMLIALVIFLVTRMSGGSPGERFQSQDVAPQKPVYSGPTTPPTAKGGQGTSGSSRVRIGEDGFWIDVSGIVPQSTVEYRYTAQGASHFEHVVVTGAEPDVFVYSGSRPTQAEVVNIVPPGGPLGGGVTSRPGAPSSPRVHPGPIVMMPPLSPTPPRPTPPRKDADEPFGGYPSAY